MIYIYTYLTRINIICILDYILYLYIFIFLYSQLSEESIDFTMFIYLFMFVLKANFWPEEANVELWLWYDIKRKSALDGTLYIALLDFSSGFLKKDEKVPSIRCSNQTLYMYIHIQSIVYIYIYLYYTIHNYTYKLLTIWYMIQAIVCG